MCLVSVWESKALPSITISDSINFSYRNMSGADLSRWSQNRSEPRLPHIITGLEDKREVSLLPFVKFDSMNIRSVRHQNPNCSIKSKGY